MVSSISSIILVTLVSLLYCCARYVDIYKALEDIARDTKLTPEERQEMKKYTRLADAFTPLAKGMNSEYANQNAYDAISIHGGSGFIMEYKCQRLFRDARIFSIYEGTTQLQVVAAIRYITNGTYLSIIKEMLENEVSDDLKALKERVAKLVEFYEAAINKVKEANDQAVHDFLARRLYNMTDFFRLWHGIEQKYLPHYGVENVDYALYYNKFCRSIVVPKKNSSTEELAQAISGYIELFDKLMKGFLAGRYSPADIEHCYAEYIARQSIII